MAVLVEVINESGSGISSSSEVLASGDGAHVSSVVHREQLIIGEAQMVFCYPRLFGEAFAFFVGYGFLRGLNVRSEGFHLRLSGLVGFAQSPGCSLLFIIFTLGACGVQKFAAFGMWLFFILFL